MAIVKVPAVALAFVVEQLRRLPGARVVGRYRTTILTALLLSAGVAFLVWGSERTPVRITLAQLAAGELSPYQSWIVVSGDVRLESANPPRRLYRLTDPLAPNASMIVVADFELALGWQTLSGQYTGTREGVPPGFNWVGYMEAEPVLAHEQPPPWIAIALALSALAIGISGRLSYPTFFSENPRTTAGVISRTVDVSVREDAPTGERRFIPATIRVAPGSAPVLRVGDRDEQPLHIHSAHTSVDVGELRQLSSSDPALIVHQPTGDIYVVFASREDRDAAYAALVADTRRNHMGRVTGRAAAT